MRAAGCQIRDGHSRDLTGVIQLEKITPEAPHWGEAEYGAIVSPTDSQAVMRRRLFVAEAELGLLGFAVGKVLFQRL